MHVQSFKYCYFAAVKYDSFPINLKSVN